ncbi:hypothetical protein [uncultured Sphingomonas sp.]|uniref:hypothetical protein n=1 Tax=uncultured Sphingomonas sp. TaxID=158754 RepID=UPI002600936E|nr:hypothetical protein [uncultured Sphingomonas sp.]
MNYHGLADQFVRDYHEIDNQITQLQAELERKKEWKAQADALMKACYGDAVADEVGGVATKPLRKRAAPKAKPLIGSDDDDEALIEALRERKDADDSFVTAHQLFEVAVSNGFKLSRVSARNRMIKLVKANPDRIIEQTKPTLGWRLA